MPDHHGIDVGTTEPGIRHGHTGYIPHQVFQLDTGEFSELAVRKSNQIDHENVLKSVAL
jgi:hypothetical protein